MTHRLANPLALRLKIRLDSNDTNMGRRGKSEEKSRKLNGDLFSTPCWTILTVKQLSFLCGFVLLTNSLYLSKCAYIDGFNSGAVVQQTHKFHRNICLICGALISCWSPLCCWRPSVVDVLLVDGVTSVTRIPTFSDVAVVADVSAVVLAICP